jgi:hypothetical protein
MDGCAALALALHLVLALVLALVLHPSAALPLLLLALRYPCQDEHTHSITQFFHIYATRMLTDADGC